MSKWRFGCGKQISVWITRGASGFECLVECGSTSQSGGVNQCDQCAQAHEVSEPLDDDESDLAWYERQGGDDN
jgi:hypothetical protein